MARLSTALAPTDTCASAAAAAGVPERRARRSLARTRLDPSTAVAPGAAVGITRGTGRCGRDRGGIPESAEPGASADSPGDRGGAATGSPAG